METITEQEGELKDKISVLFSDFCVKISFFGKHHFIVDLETNRIFYNGEDITFAYLRKYKLSYAKEHNIKKWKKTRIIYIKHYPYMIGLDKGSDGRLFWKVWDADSYRVFRGKPLWVCSYWEKKFYIKDLSNPIRIYENGEWRKPISSASKQATQLQLV